MRVLSSSAFLNDDVAQCRLTITTHDDNTAREAKDEWMEQMKKLNEKWQQLAQFRIQFTNATRDFLPSAKKKNDIFTCELRIQFVEFVFPSLMRAACIRWSHTSQLNRFNSPKHTRLTRTAAHINKLLQLLLYLFTCIIYCWLPPCPLLLHRRCRRRHLSSLSTSYHPCTTVYRSHCREIHSIYTLFEYVNFALALFTRVTPLNFPQSQMNIEQWTQSHRTPTPTHTRKKKHTKVTNTHYATAMSVVSSCCRCV